MIDRVKRFLKGTKDDSVYVTYIDIKGPTIGCFL